MLVEATAGNTGLGLALVAAQKGYRLILVIPDKMSQEKVLHLKALGAEVVMTRSDVGRGHPQYYQDLAEQITGETPNAFYINQFNNPANPLAHETTTGPEIWAQTDHELDAVVCGVGSGGTITGLSRFFARVAPQVEMVLADPAGSVLADYIQTGHIGEAGSWVVEGIGEDFMPPIADLSRVRTCLHRSPTPKASPPPATLLKHEGILAGSSSGTLVAAALRYCREQIDAQARRHVRLRLGQQVPVEDVQRLSGWPTRGFARPTAYGDLRDLIAPSFCRRGRGQRRARRTAEHRLHAHETVRRLAVAGAGGHADRRHSRRIRPAAGRQRRRRRRFGSPVAQFMTTRLRNRSRREPRIEELVADLRRRPRGDRRRRRRLSRTDHARRRVQLFAAPATAAA